MSTSPGQDKRRKREKIKTAWCKIIPSRFQPSSLIPEPDNGNVAVHTINISSSPGPPVVASSANSHFSTNEDSHGVSSSTAETARIAWHGFQLVLTKSQALLDGTPAKTPVAALNTIIGIGNSVANTKESMRELMSRTKDRLVMVDDALLKTGNEGNMMSKEMAKRIERFSGTLIEEASKLDDMSKRSLWTRILESDEDSKEVKKIIERLDESAKDFHIDISLSIERKTAAVFKSLEQLHLASWPRSRQAVYNADLDSATLTREGCTPGTRTEIIRMILDWAKDKSSAPVFWLNGMAGTGKSTIAYSICQQVDAMDLGCRDTILAASFFCSRQIEDARRRKYIVPTIVYQLARRFRSYAEMLLEADFDAADVSSRQMMELLVHPWDTSASERPSNLPPHLVVIDALDENDGGSEFLKQLLDVAEKGHLRGLKFLVTSRGDRSIVDQCSGFAPNMVCHLHEVKREEVHSDILTYLRAAVPALRDKPQVQVLALHSGGLFIYAATAVRFVSPSTLAPREQEMRLDTLLRAWPTLSESVEALLVDRLYSQILRAVFLSLGKTIRQARLVVVHTVLCAEEPVSTGIINTLLSDMNIDEDMVRRVIEDLHAVFYVSKVDGCIYWYHKSFFDFMCDAERSGVNNYNGFSTELTCQPSSHHPVLAHACFRIMQDLRFNICNHPSSFLLDTEVPDLQSRIKKNISPSLRYCLQHWVHHLIHSNSTLYQDIKEFCNTKLLFWVEAMNLIGAKGRCSPLLKSVASWLGKDPLLGGLVEYVGDATRLAAMFAGSPASLSTPHLYISTLAAYNKKSILHRDWSKNFPRIPSLEDTSISSPLLMSFSTGDLVTCVAFSPDGSCVVSASVLSNTPMHVWDPEDGRKLKDLCDLTKGVTSVVFSPDGSRIVSGSGDKTVRVWDTESGEELATLRGHKHWVRSVALSPDGSHIVSGSDDKTVRVWDAEVGIELATLIGHTKRVDTVAFSPDGSRIISGSWDCTICVWDPDMKTKIRTLNATERVRYVAFSPDGSRIASCGTRDHFVRVWDAEVGTELSRLTDHADTIKSVAFSADGLRIVSGSDDNTVRLWNAEAGSELTTLYGHTDRVNFVAFSPDGSRIVSGSSDKTIRVWDAEAQTGITALNCHIELVQAVAFSPNGTHLMSGSWERTVCVWDSEVGTELKNITDQLVRVTCIAYSPDGLRFVFGSDDQMVYVRDAETGKGLRTLAGHTSKIFSVAFSPDNSRIVSASDDGTVRVWDAENGAELMTLHRSARVVIFSPDGLRIISGGVDKLVHVWDATTGTIFQTLNDQNNLLADPEILALSSDGSRIVSASHPNAVSLWETESGKKLGTFLGHTKEVRAVALSPDGSRVLSASRDNTLRVWDVSSVGPTDTPPTTSSGPTAWNWTVDEDGWIVSVTNKLMWLPPPLRDVLYRPPISLIISPKGSVRVDFTSASLGTNWSQCSKYLTSI